MVHAGSAEKTQSLYWVVVAFSIAGVPAVDVALLGVSHSFAAVGRHGVRCDSTIGGVNQKGRPRQQGVLTITTRADREMSVIMPRPLV